MNMELTNEQEKHIWEVGNFHPLTNEQRSESDYQFLKEQYFDLMVDCLKKKDEKNIELLKQGWDFIEKSY